MAPATGTALLVLVAFVLPGFVALLIAERTYEVGGKQREPFELLLLAAYYSVVSYALVGLLTWPFHLSRATLRHWYRTQSLGRLAALGVLALLVVPAVVANAGRLWSHSQSLRPKVLGWLRIHETHRVPSGWDAFFRRSEPALVRLVLSDGRVVAGLYGSNSFAGYGEQAGDLLLEQTWVLDGDDWFVNPRDRTTGLWIPAGAIVSMELYDVGDGKSAEPEPAADAAGPAAAG